MSDVSSPAEQVESKKRGEKESGERYMAWARVEQAPPLYIIETPAFDADAHHGPPSLTFLTSSPV
jgi:hypothetical protein